MTLQEIQYKAQAIMQKWRDEDSAPYVEFVEELALMDVPEPPDGLEEAAEEYLQQVKATFLRTLNHPTAKECFIAGAEWGMNQCPLPEDTTIFMKGVAEGRRLEREEQTEWKPTRLQFKALEVAGSFFASFKDQSETMRMAWDTFHEPLESLGRDLKKML